MPVHVALLWTTRPYRFWPLLLASPDQGTAWGPLSSSATGALVLFGSFSCVRRGRNAGHCLNYSYKGGGGRGLVYNITEVTLCESPGHY